MALQDAAYPFKSPISSFYDTQGLPLAGGKIYTYMAGTNTPLITYITADKAVANPNPITLDAEGEAYIYLLPQNYKFVIKDQNGVIIKTIDNISGYGGLDEIPDTFDQFVADLAATGSGQGADLVGYRYPDVSAVSRTISDKLDEWISVKDFGVVNGSASDTTTITNAHYKAKQTGDVLTIPANALSTLSTASVMSLTNNQFAAFFDLRQAVNGGLRLHTEGRDNSGSYYSELQIVGKQNPGLVLDSLSDGTAPGYPTPNKMGSVVWRAGGVGNWQMVSDPTMDGSQVWSFNHLNSYRQLITAHGNGNIVLGQLASGVSLTVPDHANTFRGVTCLEDSSGDISLVMRLLDNSKRKIITLDTTNDQILVTNTANSAFILTLTNSGKLRSLTGVSGGGHTTTARNAISVTSADIGLSVFDTTLGKPVWLKNNVGPVWVDATGATV